MMPSGKLFLSTLAISALSLAAAAKDIWINVDFCDEILQRWKTLKRGMIAEDVTNIVRNCRRAGADGIYLRVAPLGIVFHPSKVAWDIEGAVAKGQHSPSVVARRGKEEGKGVGWLSPLLIDCFRATMKSLPDSYGTFVAACRHEGLKISFWIDIHDEMFAKFTTEHPECLVRTPDGKTFPALRDYGNETAVKDKLAELEEYIRYRPDGFFFCTSCHTRHMRIDEPDEAFGLLPAAKFTDFLRRVKALMRPHGLTLTMGTACGGTLDFCSPYFANHPKYRIGHDWKTWVDEGIADALVVADYERFNRRCDDFWRAKGVVPDGVNDPAELFLPGFTGYVKGRVPLYLHIRLPGKTPRELKAALDTDGATVLKFGLDGANLHELMIIENRKGGFDMLADMRRRFDTATNSVRTP